MTSPRTLFTLFIMLSAAAGSILFGLLLAVLVSRSLTGLGGFLFPILGVSLAGLGASYTVARQYWPPEAPALRRYRLALALPVALGALWDLFGSGLGVAIGCIASGLVAAAFFGHSGLRALPSTRTAKEPARS